MVASVFAVLAPTSIAVSQRNNFNYIGNITGILQEVLVGQNIQFNQTETANNFSSTNVVVYRYVSDDLEDSWPADSSGRIYNVNWPTTGAYYVSNNATGPKTQARISVNDPKLPLKLKVGTKDVSSIAVGSPDFKIDVGGINLFDNDQVDLVIMGPDGQIKNDTDNNQKFTDITVSELKAFETEIKTDGWGLGVYTFKVKTDEAKACGLVAESNVKELKILKGAIAVDADTTNTVELSTVTLTVTGVAGDNITVTATPCENASFKAGIDDTPAGATCTFDDTIDGDGIRKYAIEFTDTGSFSVKVLVKDGDRKDEYDTVDIAVSEKEVEFDIPSTIVIGDRINIKGTSASGTYVTVYVEDTLYTPLKNMVIDDGEFSKEITTTDIGMNVPGSVRLKAWIDCSNPSVAPKTTPDGEDAILLTTPDLTAELSAPAVAIGDSFHVTGVAKGTTSVTILTVPPKGGGGKSLISGGKGIDIMTASVSTTDHTFDRKLSVQDEAASGHYDIYVLSPGMDGVWDATNNASLISAIDERYNIKDITDPLYAGTKSQDAVFNILVDLTTTAGSDDLMWVAQIKAEEPRVTLNPIAAVGVGQPLVVSGLCNRADGYTIVVTATGMFGDLPPQTVKVYNGTFNATIDTTDAEEGTYLIKADDGDGHTDEITVIIGEAAPTAAPTTEPTAAPTAAPTAEPTAAPTIEPTAAPTTPEPPGFEAIFAIAGLLAVAYLVIRRRK